MGLIFILLIALALRTYQLTSAPVSLYWDEMDVGYQAYSILKTGKDYFGNIPFLTVHSFADFRAPLLIYLTIPFVAIFSLTPLAVRLPAAIFGVLSILLVFILTKTLFKNTKAALISALLIAFSPWNIQYSRMGFETTLMLSLFLGALVSFFKGLSNSKWYFVSFTLFALTLFSYNTAKLFVPIIVLSLGLIYIRKKAIEKRLIISVLIFITALITSFYGSIFLGGGQRFSEIAVFSDPQIASKVDYLRNESALSYTQKPETGLEARLVDKLIYNKLTLVLDRISQNYLKVFSTDFLFISGDPNLRHSPARIGELYPVEFMTIVSGLAFLIFSIKKDRGNLLLNQNGSHKNLPEGILRSKLRTSSFVLLWIVLAPLPAVITREGGTHATRLFFLLPALSIVSALGIIFLWQLLPKKISLIVASFLGILWIFNVSFFINYYFGAYKIESEKYFQYGFSEAVEQAVKYTGNYDYVIIDDRRDSAMMNYLFDTKYDPSLFQSQVNDLAFEINGFKGDSVGNLLFLKPDRRDWGNIFSKNLIGKNYVLVVSSEQLEEQTVEKVPGKLSKNQRLLDVVYYKSGGPAFYIIESKNPALSL